MRTMMKEGLGGGKYGIVEGRGEWGANHDEGRVGGEKYGIVEGRGEWGANHDEGRVGGEKYGIVEGRGEWGANHDEGRVGGGRSMVLLRGVGSGVRTMMKEGLGGGEVWYC